MFTNAKFGVLLALLLSASMWFYVDHILVPHQVADAAAHDRPRGVLSDLYPRWVGTRELLLRHRDPYSAEVTRDIQIGYYGRVLDRNRPEDPKDEQRFAYPVYVVFLLAPTAIFPFAGVRIAVAWLLGILTALSVFLWLKFLRWRTSAATSIILLILTVSSFGVVQGIKLQQPSLLVGCLIAGLAACLAVRKLFGAGILLSVATIKPQLVALPVAWLLLWAASNWGKRQGLFWGFVIGMLLLMGGGEYVLPGWMSRFATGLAAYQQYTVGGSLLDVLATRGGGALLTVLSLFGTGIVCWRFRNSALYSAGFCLVLALVLTVTVLVLPMKAPYNQVLLLPAIFLIIRAWGGFWAKGRLWRNFKYRRIWMKNILWRSFCVLAIAVLGWSWLASFLLMLASVVVPARIVQQAWAVPLWTSIGVPLVVLPFVVSLLLEISREDVSG